jgi:hypothetical protein
MDIGTSLASRMVVAVCVIVMLPVLASAQTSGIAGVVRDASGAVLPGVTVEVASPVLIEKVRTAVTDGAGLYKVEGHGPASTRSRSR